MRLKIGSRLLSRKYDSAQLTYPVFCQAFDDDTSAVMYHLKCFTRLREGGLLRQVPRTVSEAVARR